MSLDERIKALDETIRLSNTECEEYLAKDLKRALVALEYYSTLAEKDSDTPNLRREFGCGCCAQTNGPKGSMDSDCDKSVQGLTAREALKEILGE